MRTAGVKVMAAAAALLLMALVALVSEVGTAGVRSAVAQRVLERDFYFRIDGAKRGDAIAAASAVGDMNEDGRPDLIIGSPRADTGGHHNNGGAWVIFSPRRPSVIDLAHLGRHGFRIQGRPPRFQRGPSGALGLVRRDCVGGSVSAAGDVNGDGRPDVIVGDFCFSHGYASGRRARGAAYVIFGKSSRSTVDVAHLGRRGYRISARGRGKVRYIVGRSVAGVGDMNRDGRSDVIVSAEPQLVDTSREGRGGAFVIFGSRSRKPVALNRLGRRGFRIRGWAADYETGLTVEGPGDVNGDGRPDVVVGAPGYAADLNTPSSGAAYVVFGKAGSSTVDLSHPDEAGFQIEGALSYQSVGEAIAAGGDVNGDGRSDLVLGARAGQYPGQHIAGTAFVVFGKSSRSPVALAALGTGGFPIDGPGGGYGSTVAGAGDTNGDGLADMIVEVPFTEKSDAAYIVYGKRSTEPIDLANLGAGQGFRWFGPGFPRGAIGDLNGDGKRELIAGEPGGSHNGRRQSGSVYVVAAP